MQRSKSYSLSDRIDLLTVMVLTAIFSILFGIARVLEFPVVGFVLIVSMLVFIGISQVLFQRLGRPRLVSILTGIIVAVFGGLALEVLQGWPSVMMGPGIIIAGAFFGYIFGVCISSSPLIADCVRATFRKSNDRQQSFGGSVPSASSPSRADPDHSDTITSV